MQFRIPARVALAAALATVPALAGTGIAGTAQAATAPESFLQIVAHQDDDILFMNPDLSREYAAPSVTVYLTAGETVDARFPSPCAYAASRDTGARAAHARIAGVTAPTWTVTPLRLSNGRTVEVDTLDQAPQVKLVFLKLHSSGDKNYPGGTGQTTLAGLFGAGSGGSSAVTTLGSLPADGACDAAYAGQSYRHDDLVASLTELMNRFRPTVVLAQDPRVAYNYTRDITNLADNSDHIGGARFAGKAALGYHGPDGNGHFLLRNYRDYNVRIDPENVSPGVADDKRKTFLAYLGPNRNGVTGNYSGKYDPQPDPNEANFYAMFPARQYVRWSNGTARSVLDGAGSLNAFGVLDGRVQAWRESAPGGDWSGPTAVPGGEGLAPSLGVVKDAAGLIHLFGIRLDDNRIVTTAQTAPGTWSGWTDLGNPNPADPQYVGSPVPVLGHNGLLTVLVRNGGGGVSAVSQLPQGGWTANWADLGGGWVRDGLAAALATDGRVDVFAPAKDGIRHWRQSAPDGPFVQDAAFLGPAPAGPLTVGRNADGRLELFYHQAHTGQVVTQYVRADGSWTTTPDAMGGPAALEGVSVATGADGRMTVATRNGGGGVSLVSQSAPDHGFATTWPDLGKVIIGAPTVTVDAAGRRVVLAFGRDATLHAARQTAPGADSPFGSWQQIGG
ncbi:PIG-L family deacetylase [Kitasatospora sp. NPDC097643]|uniref:PIG-L family deacetylase n=1 Tax=Kitasatospora sp. NPDC097643 TaxID=3157230 RepID=UPI0033188424